MPDSLPPETLAWLHQSAAVDGATYSQVLLHLLERVEALERRPIPGTVELATPNPEAAPPAGPVPVFTEGLVQRGNGNGGPTTPKPPIKPQFPPPCIIRKDFL